MPRIIPSQLINTSSLQDLKSGNGKWLDGKLQVRTMGRLRRIAILLLPRVFMPRKKSRAAVRSLHRKLSDYKINHIPLGQNRASLLMAKANLADIVQKGNSLDIVAKPTLVDHSKLDLLIQSSDKSNDELIEELSASQPVLVPGQRRKRSPSLSRMNSLEGPASTKKAKPNYSTDTSNPFSAQPSAPERPSKPPKTKNRNKARTKPSLATLSSPKVLTPPLVPVAVQKQAEPPPPIAYQVAPLTDKSSQHEETLYQRVNGGYCKTKEQYAVLRNAFFSLNDFEKELNDEDFVELVIRGILSEYSADLFLSWEEDHYRNEAAEIMVKLNKRAAPAPTQKEQQSVTRAENQTRTHINTVALHPEGTVAAPGKRPSITYLMNRRGMPNFGSTCFFNSACQQLSVAIPAETMARLAQKAIPDEHARQVKNKFVALMRLINAEYPEVKTRDQQAALEKTFEAAQSELLTACYNHGQKIPGSRFLEILPHTRLEQIEQHDAAEFFVALCDVLKLNEHTDCALMEANHTSFTHEGKTYTLKGTPEDADALMQVKLLDEVDEGKANLQTCIDAMKNGASSFREWTTAEARQADHPDPAAVNEMFFESPHNLVKVSKDVTQLRSLTFHSNLTHGYYDKQTQTFTNRKLTERGRQALSDGAPRIRQSVYDQKTGKTVEVPMELQSVVIHQGNSLRSGHYTTLIRSQEGPWVLFNDRQPVAQYPSLQDYLAEDKHRTPYLLNYQVTESVRP